MKTGLQPFRTDLNVMMASSTNIQGQMEQVDTDLGYTWDSYTDPNSVRIGVNWGYTSSQLESHLDPELVIAIAAFLLLVIFTGYLIIYNIFQISVAGDIRFYGLLKTIGTTPRQLKRIIRQQALLLCLIGIPAGLLLGYGIGAVLVPVVLRSTQLDAGITTISTSPVIFVGSVLFALLTVLLSCSKPGKWQPGFLRWRLPNIQMRCRPRKNSAAPGERSSIRWPLPIWDETKKRRLGGGVSGTVGDAVQCTVCLCGRLQHGEVVSFMTCADFIVSTPDYFRYNPADEFITPEQIEEIAANTKSSLSGTGYAVRKPVYLWMTEDALRQDYARYESAEQLDSHMSRMEHRGDMVMGDTRIEALDNSLFDKLQVFDGDISPMLEPNNNAIAIAVSLDDYGNLPNLNTTPRWETRSPPPMRTM